MLKPIIEINDFKGGMTLNEKIGKKDQFTIGENLDFSSQLGKISCAYKWDSKEWNTSPDMPTKFNSMLFFAYDNDLYLAGNDGKIYKEDGTVAHNDSNASTILDIIGYEDKIYWLNTSYIGQYDPSGPTWSETWQSLSMTLSQSNIGTMCTMSNKLFVGDDKYVASWNGTTFTSEDLDLPEGWKINCLSGFGARYLAIGASFYGASDSESTYSKIFLWDMSSSSWNDEISIPESSINAMRFTGGYLWIWAGESSNIYVISETSRTATKIWTFVREDPTYSFNVYPKAVTDRLGTIYFGLSDSSVNDNRTADSHPQVPTGVYSFPADPNNFSLNIPFRNQDYNTEIRSIERDKPTDTESLYMGESYHNGTSEKKRFKYECHYGEVYEGSIYGDTGIYKSFLFKAPLNKKIVTEAFGIKFDKLPSNCRLDLDYKTPEDDSWTSVISNFTTVDTVEKIVPKKIKAQALKLRLKLRGDTGSGINRPFVKSIFVTGNLTDKAY